MNISKLATRTEAAEFLRLKKLADATMNGGQDDQSFAAVAGRIYRHFASQVEKRLTKSIVAIEGRIPSDAQIRKHGQALYSPQDGSVEYKWKGKPILTVLPTAFSPGLVE